MKKYISKFLESIKVTHDMGKFRSLKHFSAYKAHELQNITLYVMCPLFASVYPNEIALTFFLYVYAARIANERVLSSSAYALLIDNLVSLFKQKCRDFFPPKFFTMNMHLLQYRSFGPTLQAFWVIILLKYVHL